MGWDRGRYYTRSRKVNGRVVREYIGAGRIGELAARRDAIKRADREAETAARRAEQAELEALDAEVAAVTEAVDLAAQATLLVAGFHQHKGGDWRKRREQDHPAQT
jgi:hypothetical protein